MMLRLLLLVVCLGATANLLAAEDLDTPKVTGSLKAEVVSIAPGDSFSLLFSQEIAPGWHTYWRNPGDSGAEPKLNWELPDGVTVSEFSWPFPERIPYGPLMNFGYHDEVHLPVTVTVSEDYVGTEIVLSASGQVLVCEDICIPQKVSVSTRVPVGATVTDVESADLFRSVRASIPKPIDVPVNLARVGESLILKVGLPVVQDHRIKSVEYFPHHPDLIDNPAPQHHIVTAHGIEIELKPGFEFSEDNADLSGIIVITEDAGGEVISAFEIAAPGQAASGETGGMSLLLAVVFAFLGGLILNLMPCVFPVLSIKVLSLVESVHADGGSIRMHGLVYGAGVVLSFLVIAGALIALRLGGEAIGWGFQLQSPVVVGLLAYLFVVIGLNLLGVFETGTWFMSLGSDAGGHGYGASFATGVLATVVAAPCTAPFMGAAIGFALTQSILVSLTVFAALGVGMATPYLALCYSPALIGRLPRPGAWMETLKQLLAFPMFASAIWLAWVFGIQVGPTGMMQLLGGALLIAFAIWLVGHSAKLLVRIVAVLSFVAAIYLVMMERETITVEATSETSSDGALVYSPEALLEARQKGPVLVNFTAAWCITCKVNELNALSKESVQTAFAERSITYMKADWTNEDPVITAALQEYGRSGVPLYLLYRPGAERADVLPQILTEGIVLDAISDI